MGNRKKTEAFKSILKSANSNNKMAQYKLAFFYLNRNALKRDFRNFHYWILRSANAGYAKAQNELGISYQRGEGLKRDSKNAEKWFRKAANQNNRNAMFNLGLLYDDLKGKRFIDEPRKAVYWMKKAASRGVVHAQWSVGCRYMDGDGVKLNHNKAIKLFKMVVDSEDSDEDRRVRVDAKVKLGYIYYSGIGIRKNLRASFEWYLKAARSGSKAGIWNLGLCYERGEGVSKNMKKALFWFQKAARLGHKKSAIKVNR